MDNGLKEWVFTLVVVGVILIAIGVVIRFQDTNFSPKSNFNPIENSNKTKKDPEPVIDSWKLYSNDQYNFSIEVPEMWNIQEYPPIQPNGGFMVAFGPNDLPCKTCTYFKNGYYSIKLFNEKSDPEYYKYFQTQVSNIGKVEGLKPITIGKYSGVMSNNTISIDHKDWVYELSLDAKEGTMQIPQSKIFQKASHSFKFTGIFGD